MSILSENIELFKPFIQEEILKSIKDSKDSLAMEQVLWHLFTELFVHTLKTFHFGLLRLNVPTANKRHAVSRPVRIKPVIYCVLVQIQFNTYLPDFFPPSIILLQTCPLNSGLYTFPISSP